MDNYNEIMDKEQVMNRKESLVDETITKGKLTQYEIISRMFDGLLKEIEEYWLNNNFKISNDKIEDIVKSKSI